MKAIRLLNAAKVGGKLHTSTEVLLVGKGKDIELKDAEFLIKHGAAEETVEPSASQSSPKGDELSVEEMADLEDLSQLKVDELKSVCKFLELEDYSSLNKAGLIKLIEDHRGGVNIDEMDEEELRVLAEEEGIALPEDADVETIRELISAVLGA